MDLHQPFATTNSPAAATMASLLRAARLLQQRRFFILLTLSAALLLGAFYFLTVTRKYEAHATLLVTHVGSDAWSASMAPRVNLDAHIPTYEKLFFSEAVLKPALASLEAQGEEACLDFLGHPRDKWIAILRENLSTFVPRRTNMVELSYQSRSPHTAERIVDTTVKSYIAFIKQHHRVASVEVVNILDKERSNVESRLLSKQQDLLVAKRHAGDLGLTAGTEVVHPLVQRVVRLNEALIKVQGERLELEANLAVADRAARGGDDLRRHLSSLDAIAGKQLIANAFGFNQNGESELSALERKLNGDHAKLEMLNAHYGPKHPRIVELRQTIANEEAYLREHAARIDERLSGERGQYVASLLRSMLREKLAKARAEEQTLVRQYQAAENEAASLNDRLVRLRIVENELERLRQLHDTLLNRIANIDINQNRSDVRVDVVGNASAGDRPVSPRLGIVACIVLGVGVAGGIIMAYLVDYLDDRFKSPGEISDQLGVSVLAMVRKMDIPREGGIESLQMHIAPTDVASEAFRTLRTSLAFSAEPLHRLAISSGEPGDGKSLLLANLAIAFAQGGKKTLLIDADLRKPGLSTLVGMRRVPGLADYLTSEQSVKPQQTIVNNLDVLPCGAKPLNPNELLSGPRMSQLLAWAEQNYDQVLIDCPPSIVASDAAISGRLCDGMLLVVHPEKNHRQTVIRAVQALRSLEVNLVGIVLNQVSAQTGGGDYVADGGYGYGFGDGPAPYGGDDPDTCDDDRSQEDKRWFSSFKRAG